MKLVNKEMEANMRIVDSFLITHKFFQYSLKCLFQHCIWDVIYLRDHYYFTAFSCEKHNFTKGFTYVRPDFISLHTSA